MNKTTTLREGVRFGNGKTGASDRFGDAETYGETACESGFAGANIADEFNNVGFGFFDDSFGEAFAKIQHSLFGSNLHKTIIS